MAMPLNLPIVAESTAPSVPPKNRPMRAADVRTALRLTYITLVWMTIEGIDEQFASKQHPVAERISDDKSPTC